MSHNITKEDVLQIKLNLIKIQNNKNAAAIAHKWEAAAKLRDEEKKMREQIQHLKNDILNELTNIKHSSENSIDDYVLLQGLLFEFHSNEFYDDCRNVKNVETAESHVERYWNLRNQMQQELKCFLNEEYAFLREQMHQFVKEGDQAKGQMVVRKLALIGDLIIKIEGILKPNIKL